MEVLAEVQRVEERLRPFMERTHSILGAASSADYNNNVCAIFPSSVSDFALWFMVGHGTQDIFVVKFK